MLDAGVQSIDTMVRIEPWCANLHVEVRKRPSVADSDILVLLCDRVFGQANEVAVMAGKVGRECRGLEHHVELVWSKPSGKQRRLYCNKIEITTATKGPYNGNKGGVVYTWKLESGETLQILANRVCNDTNPYRLLVNGVDFVDLPRVCELGRSPESPVMQQYSEGETTMEAPESDAIADGEEDGVAMVSSSSLGFRLSMAGFRSSTFTSNQIEDELHSTLYTSVIESLRSLITTFLPQTEEMVSRAIIHAFFADMHSSGSLSLNSFDETSPIQVEVDCLWEAHRWKTLNMHCFSSLDVHESTLRFMQTIVDDIFIRVRNEELNAVQAARVVHSVGAMLELKFAADVAHDSVVFSGLETGATLEDLHRFFELFGRVDSIAFARSMCSFALCRFKKDVSPVSVVKTFQADEFTFGREKPSLLILLDNRFVSDKVVGEMDAVIESEQHLDDSGDDSTCVAVPPSTESSVLDGSIGPDGLTLYLDTTQYTWMPQHVCTVPGQRNTHIPRSDSTGAQIRAR
jgi:hypothetical protein